MILLVALLAIVAMSAILAAPLAFFTMLFLGNVGVNLGFWALLPGAIALRIATTSLATTKGSK